MKKIIMMFIVTTLVLCTGCTAQNQMVSTENKEKFRENLVQAKDSKEVETITAEILRYRQSDAFSYDYSVIYDLEGYTSKVYTFDPPNDFYEVVIMDNLEHFIFIIHNTGDHGLGFESVVYENGTFLGLTTNYVLFEEPDRTITAISLEKNEDSQPGEYCRDIKNFKKLPKEEQKSAILPTGYYQCSF